MSLALKSARAATQGTHRGQVQAGGLGGFLKGVARGVGGFLVGGPAGAAAAALGPALAPKRQDPAPGIPFPFPGPGGIRVNPGAALPGGRPFIQREGQYAGESKLACPSGYHPNKSDYFLKDGTFIAKGSRCVRNRRRNPMNPRALDRAIGRMNSAKKLQNKLSEFSTGMYTASGKKKQC